MGSPLDNLDFWLPLGIIEYGKADLVGGAGEEKRKATPNGEISAYFWEKEPAYILMLQAMPGTRELLRNL